MLLLSEFTLTSCILFFLCAVLIGMSKTGVPGVGIAVVPMLAIVFGSKASTGVLLPILIFADIFSLTYYHKHAEWKSVLKALPWAIIGVIVAVIVGKTINDKQFKLIVSIVIFICVFILIWREVRKKESIPQKWYFASFMGLVGGFATMIGNAAGPIFSVYFLALHHKKNTYIGATAWFFLIINLIKVPFHILSWETISMTTFKLDLLTIPFILIGAFFGVKIVKIIPEKAFRFSVIAVTSLSAFLMLF